MNKSLEPDLDGFEPSAPHDGGKKARSEESEAGGRHEGRPYPPARPFEGPQPAGKPRVIGDVDPPDAMDARHG